MNFDPLIIGIAGRAGAGKDTVGQMLANLDFGRVAFADPLRVMIHALLSDLQISADYMHKRSLKESEIPELGVSYRHMVQTLGTEWGRDLIAPDFWTKVAKRSIDQLATSYDRIAITDVRFVNEVEAILSWGGIVIWVDRFQADPVRDHVSETSLHPDHPGIYARIDNGGTQASTWEQITKLVSRITAREVEPS